jgi:hypothetical protein
VEPLDLSKRPPRSCFAELDGLMLMPRTIDKLRALLPGGDSGGYVINGEIKGISGYLLGRLGISEADLREAVAAAKDDDDVASWLRERVDTSAYPAINNTLLHIAPRHAEDPEIFRRIYVETMTAHPELDTVIEIIEADDKRSFRER